MHNLCVFGLKKLFLSVSIYVLVWPSVVSLTSDSLAGVSNQQPAGHRQPRMARNAARHKIVNLLKTLRFFFLVTCLNVFNVWPKTTLLLPVWPRDSQKLDNPIGGLCYPPQAVGFVNI